MCAQYMYNQYYIEHSITSYHIYYKSGLDIINIILNRRACNYDCISIKSHRASCKSITNIIEFFREQNCNTWTLRRYKARSHCLRIKWCAVYLWNVVYINKNIFNRDLQSSRLANRVVEDFEWWQPEIKGEAMSNIC